MNRRQRPPLYWKTLIYAAPGLLIGAILLAFDGHDALALALVLIGLGLFSGPWLLSPWSRSARRMIRPTDRDFERVERAADWLGSLPLFGVIWRGAERMTGNVGRREAEEYRRWLRDHDE